MIRPVLLSIATCVAVSSAAMADGAPRRECLNAAETREAVAAHKLASPLIVQRTAAAHASADPLRSRLCRWNDDYVYEITLLRRDGKVVRVFIKATDGVVVGARGE
jgi:uncharacterized membrane protein YkoI